MKICPLCNEASPFHKDKQKKDGLYSICKGCRKERASGTRVEGLREPKKYAKTSEND